ncbi:hypothetical protein HYY74_01105 [Candidatus Woesearchaeota archaeon]|nr:hypothetical protein [Candidatus Woesearchaeota archaeon]
MIVRTYEKLGVFIDRWVAGAIDLLIIESPAGLGKSTLVSQKLKGVPHLAVNSHITPLECHKRLYEYKDELVWFDDVSLLLSNRIQVSILKQVAETQPVKTICYYTTSELLEDVPMKFRTSSRVLISCNSIEASNQHIEAIKDRGFFIRFLPRRQEVISKLREIAESYSYLESEEKAEVLQLILASAHHCKNLTLRTLVKGFQLYQYYKLTGIDWKTDLLAEMGIDDKLITLNELLTKHGNDIERLKEWQWSRQTYYSYKKLLLQEV